MDKQHQLVREILEERKKQDERWGVQYHDPFTWNVILMEEVGETARAVWDNEPEDYRKELIQVAAVALAMLESYDRGDGNVAWTGK